MDGGKKLLLEEKSKYSFHYIAGHSLQWYLKFSGRAIVFLAGFNILTLLISSIFSYRSLVYDLLSVISFFIEISVFTIIGYRLYKEISFKTLITGWKINSLLINATIMGFIVGFFSAVYKWFWIQETWTFYNLTIEPVYKIIWAVIFSLIGALYYRLFHFKKQI